MSGATSFTVTVPLTADGVQLPLMQLRLSLDLVQNQPVTFNVTSGKNVTTNPPQGPFSPSPAGTDITYVFGNDPSADDIVDFIPPSNALAANDPQLLRYELYLTLNTDYDQGTCATKMTANETWTIAVTAGSPNIAAAGVGSFSRHNCSGPFVPVRPGGQVKLATVDGPGLGEQESRPGVDAVLVLDRSGSMSSPAINGQATPTRITELQQSFGEFSNVWTNLRAQEGTPAATDNIGVTIFDDQILWWPTIPNGLNAFTAAVNATIQGNTNTITARNNTSIGSALIQADGALNAVDPTRRRVILLMSDGLQNTDQMVGVMNNQVVTYSQNTPNQTTSLPNQAKYQIYTVTVGPSNLVNAQINQQIAQATNGFYTNSEDNATLLDQFFLELLQNFVHFTSWETFRLIQAQLTRAAPTYTATVPVSTTTTSVLVALRSVDPSVFLRLSVTPPGEANSTQAISGGDGTAVLSFSVPTSASYNYVGKWTIVIDVAPELQQPEIARAIRGDDASAGGGVMFNLAMLGDDIGLRSELTIVPADYIPGQPIQLEARLIQFGKLVKGLGGQPGDKLSVEVVKPGVGVGDLLSDSTAPSTQPFATDPINPAQAKLQNQLQANPGSLNRISGDVVTLVDDGTGVYRGSYAVQTPGHYNFLFGTESSTKDVGGFSREQLKTVYVRAKPDGTATTLQLNTQVIAGGGNLLSITFTPRTQFGNRLGPGWANYFWFTSPGVTPFKGEDNLNGTYTATLSYNGPLPPPVTLNFIDVPIIIGDQVPPENLPVPLGPNTVLVPAGDYLPYIGTWLVLGPIFDPRQQPKFEPGDPPRPTAGQIVEDIDNHLDRLNPLTLTSDPAHGPNHGDIVHHYGSTLMASRPYIWRKRYFAGMEWNNIDDVRDDIHQHLVGDHSEDQFDVYDHLNFAGKHHAMVFFLAYIISPDSRSTRIALRHGDAIRVWLNGVEIKKGSELPFLGDHDIADYGEILADITLHSGTNMLLAAIADTDREWGFSARIEDYQGLDITADRPNHDPIAACTSTNQFVCVAGDGNAWNPKDLDRALFCSGNKTWRGRVRLADEHFKIVGHVAGHLDWLWWGLEGLTGATFNNEVPGLYDVIFNEDDPSHPVLILVKPFSKRER